MTLEVRKLGLWDWKWEKDFTNEMQKFVELLEPEALYLVGLW
jgi:hypothetical protein